jgi:hypothetical protein
VRTRAIYHTDRQCENAPNTLLFFFLCWKNTKIATARTIADHLMGRLVEAISVMSRRNPSCKKNHTVVMGLPTSGGGQFDGPCLCWGLYAKTVRRRHPIQPGCISFLHFPRSNIDGDQGSISGGYWKEEFLPIGGRPRGPVVPGSHATSPPLQRMSIFPTRATVRARSGSRPAMKALQIAFPWLWRPMCLVSAPCHFRR